LNGKILVFLFEDMTDYEITFVCHLLGADAGKEIITIAYEDKLIKGRSGLLYKPSGLVKDFIEEDVDGIMIAGGWYGQTEPELLQLIQNLNSKGRLISAICGAGTVFLAKAGVLNNVKYTTPIIEWTQKQMEVFGKEDPFPRENFVWERIVRERNIITAQGIAFIDFAIEICDWYQLFENEEEKDAFITNIKGL
jgi:putative intracellular protease/amidase